MKYAICHPSTFSDALEIRRMIDLPDSRRLEKPFSTTIKNYLKRNLASGESAIEVSNRVSDADHYIDAKTRSPVSRPSLSVAISDTQIAADGQSAITLTGLEQGLQISVTGPSLSVFTATSHSHRLSFTFPGEYHITVDPPFPYRKQDFIVYAT